MEHRPETRGAGLVRRLALIALVGLACGAAPAARALTLSVGPVPLVDPSDVGGQPLAGTLSFEIDMTPFSSPFVLRLTEVSIAGAGFSISLDPTLTTPGLGVTQVGGAFQIPTLFLRVNDGVNAFDLAIPNVTGQVLFDAVSTIVGLRSAFEIDTGAGIELVTITAIVPEPGTALLVALGLSLVASRSRAGREITR